ncbi:MAG: molybdopterin-dependent oxidoreductase [Desulfomonilaceae bacterium]|nr:molybdopterin-dependent oxidoreductase [Desulfomonilaceae bacterium]
MTDVTRREFIRTAALMGGVSLFAGCTLFHESGPVPEYIKGAPGVDPIETLPGIDNVYTVCALCPGNCGICCRVAQGSVVKIGGSPFNPVSVRSPLPFSTPLEDAAAVGASVCAVGGSGIQTLYNPFRVAKPLKRVGPRGSRKWKAVTWSEALGEITKGGNLFGEGHVDGLESIKDSGERLSFLAGAADWGSLNAIRMFLSAFPGASLARDKAHLTDQIGVMAAETVFGRGTGIVDTDYARVRLLLSFGDAPLDSGTPLVSLARQISDARISGRLRWAVVDPRLSTSASKSDLWVPVVPGTDINLALAIMKALLDNHAEALRVPRNAVESLIAGRTVEGLIEPCGISSDIPLRLAGMLAQEAERSAVIAGRGILSQPNGLEAATAIFSLNRIVGSAPGSGGLTARNDEFLEQAEKRLPIDLSMDWSPKGLDDAAKALIIWRTDPVYDASYQAVPYLKDRTGVPLLIAISTEITETAALADYILPDTTYLERWDICELPASTTPPGIGLRSPAVGGFDRKTGRYFPILPDTKPMEEILIETASALKIPGFGEESPNGMRNAWGYYEKAVPAVLGAMRQAGFPVSDSEKDVARALARGGFFGEPKARRAVKTAPSEAFRLPEGSFAVYSAHEAAPEDALILMAYTLPFHRSPDSGLNQWLLEVLPENPLLVNVGDARRHGIGRGDKVTVTSLDGKTRLTCTAQLVPGIRPGVVALARGFGYRESGVAPHTVNGVTTEPDVTRGAGVNPADMAPLKGAVRVRIEKA